MTETNTAPTPQKLWWMEDAWSDNALVWLDYHLDKGASPEALEDYFVRCAEVAGRNQSSGFGASPLTPAPFMKSVFDHFGFIFWDNVDGDWKRNPEAGFTDENMFDRWKAYHARRDGWVSPSSRNVYTKHSLSTRANLIAQTSEWSAEEAETILAYTTGFGLDGNPDEELAEEFWGRVSQSINAIEGEDDLHKWGALVKNPFLPLGDTAIIFQGLGKIILQYFSEQPVRRGVEKARWLVQNPNTPAVFLAILNEELEEKTGNVSSISNFQQSIMLHPNWKGSRHALTPVKKFSDEWVEYSLTAPIYRKDGSTTTYAVSRGAFEPEAADMLANPACEEQVKTIIKHALHAGQEGLLNLFAPAVPAVLYSVEREMTGEAGNLPMEWLLEVVPEPASTQ